MKTKFILLILFFAGSVCELNAAQIIAGEIFYRQDTVNPMKFSVTVNLYSYELAAVTQDSIPFNWGDSSSSFAQIQSSTLVVNSIYQNSYSAPHLYTSIPNSGVYVVSTYILNRINGIININNGNGINIPFYIEAKINLQQQSLFFGNSSPVLNALPAFYAYRNQIYQYNILPVDTHNDSLLIERVIPLADKNVYVPTYLLPDQYLPGTDNHYSVNYMTGEIIWDSPPAIGIFSTAIKISEFRNGQFFGSIMRDQNIYVDIDTNTSINLLTNTFYFEISPNPATTTLTITTNANTTTATAQIFTIEGKAATQKIPLANTNTVIDIAQLPKGLYLVAINEGGSVPPSGVRGLVKKFVKE